MEHRISPSKRGYGRTWQALRRSFLNQYPLCGDGPTRTTDSRCKAQGIVQAAEQVDHIVRHRMDSERLYDWSNLQALCARCHAAKTGSGR